jgi:hypothetical protein
VNQVNNVENPDPMRQADQPALTTSSGRIWLIVGGLAALAGLIVLVPMAVAKLPPPGVAIGGAILVAVSYAAMIVVRFATPPGKGRLNLLLVLMLALVGIALVASAIVAFAASQLGA